MERVSFFRVDKVIDALTPTARKWVSVFSLFVSFVFILAILIYSVVRAHAALESPAATVLTSQNVPAMNIPVLTVCPMTPQASLRSTECVFEQGASVVGDCLATVLTVQVNIEGMALSCLQYNNAPNGPVYVATDSSSELGTKTVVDNSKVPVGEPLGAYAIIHPQSTPPTFEWDHVFVADPGTISLVLLKNTTEIAANGTSVVDFEIKYSHVDIGANDTLSLMTADIDLLYPEMIAYYDREVPIYIQHEWLGEVGGLAALLYFLHTAIMWPLALIVYFTGHADLRTPGKSMVMQVDD